MLQWTYLILFEARDFRRMQGQAFQRTRKVKLTVEFGAFLLRNNLLSLSRHHKRFLNFSRTRRLDIENSNQRGRMMNIIMMMKRTTMIIIKASSSSKQWFTRAPSPLYELLTRSLSAWITARGVYCRRFIPEAGHSALSSKRDVTAPQCMIQWHYSLPREAVHPCYTNTWYLGGSHS